MPGQSQGRRNAARQLGGHRVRPGRAVGRSPDPPAGRPDHQSDVPGADVERAGTGRGGHDAHGKCRVLVRPKPVATDQQAEHHIAGTAAGPRAILPSAAVPPAIVPPAIVPAAVVAARRPARRRIRAAGSRCRRRGPAGPDGLRARPGCRRGCLVSRLRGAGRGRAGATSAAGSARSAWAARAVLMTGVVAGRSAAAGEAATDCPGEGPGNEREDGQAGNEREEAPPPVCRGSFFWRIVT